MDRARADSLIAQLGELRLRESLDNRHLGMALAVPAETVQKWFAQGSSRRLPSEENLRRIERFLESHSRTREGAEDTWRQVLQWWETQHQYASVDDLATDLGWDADSLASDLSNKTIPPRVVLNAIAAKTGVSSAARGELVKLAKERAAQVKNVLLVLEYQLRAFRDGTSVERDVLRRELDFTDVGYISSLLGMLSEEQRFERWLALTGKRFGFFRRTGVHSEENPDTSPHG